MKLSLVLPVLFGVSYGLSPVAQFDLDHDIFAREDFFDQFAKRDVNTFVLLLSQVQLSNVVFDILHQLNNNTQVQAYYQMLSGLLAGSNSSSISRDTIMPYVEHILNLTQTSGLLNTTVNSLLFNDTNLAEVSTFAGDVLASPNNTWICQLLYNLGQGDELSVANINQLIKENHAAVAANSGKDILFKREEFTDELFARAENATAGSASLFLTNILTTAINSTLVADFFGGLNQTDFITNFVLQFIKDPEAQSGVLNVVNLLNSTGVFNNLDLNYYFKLSKQYGIISNAVQYVMSDPVISPQVGKIFNTLEANGVYQSVWQNMYGSKK